MAPTVPPAAELVRGRDLSGQQAIVTGANTGIGKETARVLALAGASVILACRSLAKGEEARRDILSTLPQSASNRVECQTLDLGSLASVRTFAASYLKADRPLHLLINNAGVYPVARRETQDGFEECFGVNHLGTFLLTNLLLPALKKVPAARVVTVASGAYMFSRLTPDFKYPDDLQWQKKYVTQGAYGNSKLLNIMFANALQRRLVGTGIVSNSLHPGVIKTDLNRDAPAGSFDKFVKQLNLETFTIEQGAATTIHVAVAPELAAVGGKFFSDCQEAEVQHICANSIVAQEKLWALSEQLVGITAARL